MRPACIIIEPTFRGVGSNGFLAMLPMRPANAYIGHISETSADISFYHDDFSGNACELAVSWPKDFHALKGMTHIRVMIESRDAHPFEGKHIS